MAILRSHLLMFSTVCMLAVDKENKCDCKSKNLIFSTLFKISCVLMGSEKRAIFYVKLQFNLKFPVFTSEALFCPAFLINLTALVVSLPVAPLRCVSMVTSVHKLQLDECHDHHFLDCLHMMSPPYCCCCCVSKTVLITHKALLWSNTFHSKLL